MKTMKIALAALLASGAVAAQSYAQDEATFRLPEQCVSGAGAGHGAHGGGTSMGVMAMPDMDMSAMSPFQRQNMEKMLATMPAMMEAMMHDDPDVAFACAMIAHYQGAIDMARIQLEHGEDEWIRGLAEQIIEAQLGEIDAMKEWLADHAR